MNTPTLFNNLSTKLGLLKEKLSIENSTNNLNINIQLENVYIKILNEVYDLNLINTNKKSSNFIGIDAIDKEKRVGVQITSTFSKVKILKTINNCVNSKIFDQVDNLKFVFLRDRKSLSKKALVDINNAIGGKISFNEEEDIIDNITIYQKLFFENNIIKLNKVISVLDDFLGTLPTDKTSSFSSIAVVFNEEEFDNTYNLIDIILKQGVNVYIESKKTYFVFKKNDHRFFEYLILIDNVENIEHIKNYIVILSKNFIKNNFVNLNQTKSKLLLNLITNESNSKIICFDPYIENIKDINLKGFNKPYTAPIEKDKLLKFVNETISGFNSLIDEKDLSLVNVDSAIKELISINPQFEFKILEESSNFKIIRFFISGMDMEMVYIVLKNSYVLKSVIEKVKTLKELSIKNINILVPKRAGSKTRKQVDNIVSKTNINNTFFLDDFFFDKSLQKFKQKELLNISDFIDPVILRDGNYKHLNDLLNWVIDEKYPSIGILKASGGVGKTTLAEKIHDILINDEENKFLVLFIDSSSFIENFKINDLEEDIVYDLYNIYKNCHPEGEKIDKATFDNNYFHGNILMIIDGVDEVVSTISNFNLDAFLKRLVQLNTKVGKGKILLTCRDAYVDDIEAYFTNEKNSTNENLIAEFELLPFDEKLAKDYFKKNDFSEHKIRKSMSLLNSFLGESKHKEYKYPPFVLEVVSHFMALENDIDREYNMSLFNSDYLLEKHSTDYIIYQIFTRERLKKQEHGFDLSVDQQVAFFSLMTTEKQAKLEIKEVSMLLSKIGHIARLKETSEALIDHPFLKKKKDILYFNFKFLKGEFYIISLLNILKEKEAFKINDFIVQILASKCNYDSIIVKGLLDKIEIDSYFNEEVFFKSIINIINVLKPDSQDDIIKKKAICNLFLILCKYCQSKNLYINNGYIDILKKVFSEDGNEFINRLYLIDIPEVMNLKIDFSDLYIEYSHIENYNDFFNSKFNEHTYFVDSCLITNLNFPKNFNYDDLSMKEENFHNVQGDNSIHKVLQIKEQGIYAIESDIRKFLKCFCTGKQLNYKIPKSHVRKKFNLKDVDIKIIEALIELNVLEDSSNGSYTLNNSYSKKINKFVNQGILFAEINKAFDIIIRK